MTVIVGGDPNQAQTAQNSWTICQKREMAESLRSKLLDPNGQQALAAETQVHKAARKKMKAQSQADKVARRALREERRRAREAEHRRRRLHVKLHSRSVGRRRHAGMVRPVHALPCRQVSHSRGGAAPSHSSPGLDSLGISSMRTCMQMAIMIFGRAPGRRGRCYLARTWSSD